MIILGIETSGQVASVALQEDDKILACMSQDDKLTHSQTLLPMIDLLMRRTGRERPDLIAVSAGPGSFTGLRIGAATAKGLAAGWGVPVSGISTLEVLAANLFTDDLICPIMDARRRQMYSAVYRLREDGMETVVEPGTRSVDELVAVLPDDLPVRFVGDGVPVYRDCLAERLPMAQFAPAHLLKQNAAALTVLARGRHMSGDRREFKLEYLRKPQAEREREERLAAEAEKREQNGKEENVSENRLQKTDEVVPEIRRAVPTDGPTLYLIEKRCFGDSVETWSECALEDTAGAPDHRVYLAELNGNIVGYLSVQLTDEAYLEKLCVIPEERRKGIGRRLLKFAFEDTDTDFVLEVRSENKAARALYTTMGFYEAGVRKRMYESPEDDAVVMRRKRKEKYA